MSAVSNHRKLPPYARQLADARKLGMVPELPAGFFVVALGWSCHAQIKDLDDLPSIVLPLDAPFEDYDLRPLAGLDLLILYERSDVASIEDLLVCLLPIRLRKLAIMSTSYLFSRSSPVDDLDCKVFREWP